MCDAVQSKLYGADNGLPRVHLLWLLYELLFMQEWDKCVTDKK
jgi:hypothetical protein